MILHQVAVAEPWRGHGLGPILAAHALHFMAPNARLAACRISPADFADAGVDRLWAELESVRVGALLERIGFRRWREVILIVLRNPRLADAGFDVLCQWWPRPHGQAAL